MLSKQLHRAILVPGGDHGAKAAAHVEDVMHLIVGDIPALLDQFEDRMDR